MISSKKILSIVLIVFLCISVLSVFGKKPSNKKVDTTQTIEGKYISFLGDSITTYENYSNNSYYNSFIGSQNTYYSKANFNVDNTYWMKTIANLGVKLCVNNSEAGRMVTLNRSDIKCACEDVAQNLHNDRRKITPDIIVVYIGINDYRNGVKLGTFDGINSIYDTSTKTYIGNQTEFADAYATMVHKMKSAYPKADIYLCTLEQYNTEIESWNTVIKNIASAFGCDIVDFYNRTSIDSSNLTNYTLDSLHPNVNGMKEMARVLTERISKNYD